MRFRTRDEKCKLTLLVRSHSSACRHLSQPSRKREYVCRRLCAAADPLVSISVDSLHPESISFPAPTFPLISRRASLSRSPTLKQARLLDSDSASRPLKELEIRPSPLLTTTPRNSTPSSASILMHPQGAHYSLHYSSSPRLVEMEYQIPIVHR